MNAYEKKDGMTKLQKKACDKYTLYEKSWERMNRLVVGKNQIKRRISLLDNQRNYMSPREDCLTEFYEFAHKSVSMCPNEKKRSIMIEKM